MFEPEALEYLAEYIKKILEPLDYLLEKYNELINEIKYMGGTNEIKIRGKKALHVAMTIQLGTKLIELKEHVINLGLQWTEVQEAITGLKLRTAQQATRLAAFKIDEKYYYLTVDVLESIAKVYENDCQKNMTINEMIEDILTKNTNLDEEKYVDKNDYIEKYSLYREGLWKLKNKSICVPEDQIYKIIMNGSKITEDICSQVQEILSSSLPVQTYFEYILANNRVPKSLEEIYPNHNAQAEPVVAQSSNVQVGSDEKCAEEDGMENVDNEDEDKEDSNILFSTDNEEGKLSSAISRSCFEMVIANLILKSNKITSGSLEADKMPIRILEEAVDSIKQIKNYWYPEVILEKDNCAEETKGDG